jgi:AcrR family transcriptional regulator
MDASAQPLPEPELRSADSLSKIKASARKLFIERGYHDTRPQDIARTAGLGHGTFYLHYRDKRDCFFAFVEDARAEFHTFVCRRVIHCITIECAIVQTLEAVYAFTDENPGLLNMVMVDESIFGADMQHSPSAAQRWGWEWARMIRNDVRDQEILAVYETDIAGQVVVGAMTQCLQEGDRMGIAREQVIANVTKLLTRALKPEKD